jgi:probable HAF family extracellular repeat protein
MSNYDLIATIDDPSGSTSTVARDINNSGQIVGSGRGTWGDFGFEEKSPGTFVTYGNQAPVFPLTASSFDENSINNTGDVVGTVTNSFKGTPEPTYGLILHNNGTPNTSLSYAENVSVNTFANGINDADEVVGYFRDGGGLHGFLYNNGTYTALDDPAAQGTTEANGINNSGQIVGYYIDGNGLDHGFLYSNGTYTTLDDPLGVKGTVAEGINNSGQIVGYYVDGNGLDHGFLDSNGTYTTLDDPNGAKGTIAYGINDQGEIVGGYTDASSVSHGFLAAPASFASTDWQTVGVGDFNGDGKADLAWQHTPDHQVQLQFFDGNTPTSSGPIANSPFDASWSVVAQADYNGDGNQDLVYRHASDGLTEIQLLKGASGIGGGVITNNPFDASWNIVAAGDFNGDGKSDLAWRRPSDGLVEEQFLNGNNAIGGGIIQGNPFDASWNIVASSDFNSDGKSDLVWQRPSDGLVEIEFLNGLHVAGGGIILSNPFGQGWSVAGAGDFNGDGHTDLVWHRASDGLTEIQFLNGITPTGGGAIINNPFDASWSVAGTSDFNGDGRADLVWRHSGDGLTEIQYMNGVAPIGGGVAVSLDLGAGTHGTQLLPV